MKKFILLFILLPFLVNAQQLGADFSISNFPESATNVTLNKGVSYTLNNLSTNLCEITNYTWTIIPYSGGSTTGYTISSNTATHPTISFSVSGIYTVKLEVLTYRNSPAYSCGTATATKIKTAFINVPYSTPVTDFIANNSTASSISVLTNETISLTDKSTNNPTSWAWSISPSSGWSYASGSSSSQNPSVRFSTAGTYSISLAASNSSGSNTKTKTNYILVSPISPVVTSPINLCQGITANALTATGTSLKWYTTNAGGTSLSQAPVPSTSSTGTISYYVSQTINGIESPRAKIDVIVNAPPAAPTVVPISYCQGTNAAPLTANGSNLKWYNSASGGTGSSVAPTPSTSAVGTTPYYVSQTTNGCESARTQLNVSITTSSIAQPAGISATATIVCQGQNNVVYSISAVSGATSYTWTYSGTGASFSGNTNSISINYSSSATSGTLSVVANTACSSSLPRTLAITVNPRPVQPSVFTASVPFVCAGQNNVVYTVPVVAGASGYAWSYSGTGASFISNTNTVSINFSSTATSGTLSVAAINACGNGTARTLSVIVDKPTLPDFTVSSPSVCIGQSNVLYTLPSSVGTSNYTWSYSGTGANITNTANSASINFSTTATSGILRVTANNTCGVTSKNLNITVNSSPPTQPEAFSIYSSSVCQSQSGVVYTVPPVSGAISYQWSYSGTGATFSSTTNSVTISFSATATSGTLSVIANGPCNSSPARTLAIVVNSTLTQPSFFNTLSRYVCIGSNNVLYSVPSVVGATSYIWSYSGKGASFASTSNSVSISFSNTATSGTLSVAAVYPCGTSSSTSLDIYIEKPVLPDFYSDYISYNPTSVCAGTVGVVYSIPGPIGVYNPPTWSYSGNGVTLGSLSGGTTGIELRLNFSSTATSGTLLITANNSCGVAKRTLDIKVHSSVPAPLDNFTTFSTNVVAGQKNVIYTIPPESDATSYTWYYVLQSTPRAVPINTGVNLISPTTYSAHGSGLGPQIFTKSNTISINFSTNARSGSLFVYPKNGCGAGGGKEIGIIVDSIPIQPVNPLPTQILWQKAPPAYKYGTISNLYTTYNNIDKNTISTPDGGSVVQLFERIFKIDRNGTIVWEMNRINNSQIKSITYTPDNGYLLVGTRFVNNNNFGILIKLNENGVIVWEKLFDSIRNSIASIVVAADGNFVIAGVFNEIFFKEGYNSAQYRQHYWIAKIDGSGEIIWEKKFGSDVSSYAKTIVSTPDGGFIIAGNTGYNDSASAPSSGDRSEECRGQDYWVIKIDSNGNLLWENTIKSWSDDILKSVTATLDGGILLAGLSSRETISGDKTGKDLIWIVKLDSNGDITWDQSIGTSTGSGTNVTNILTIPDGSYIVVSGSEDGSGYILTQLNKVGNVIGTKRIRGGKEFVKFASITTDGAIIVGGLSTTKTGMQKTVFPPDLQLIGPGGQYSDDYEAHLWILKLGYCINSPSEFSQSSINVCQGQNSVVYTVAPVAGATSYSWSYSGTGATFSSTTNSVSINFSATATSGTLSVTARNDCGVSLPKILDIVVNPALGTITSFSNASPTVCQGQNNIIYSIPAVSGAISYTWTYSGTGATFSSTTNNVSINFGNTSTSGNLSVVANGACGLSPAQALAISVKPLNISITTPTIISGTNTYKAAKSILLSASPQSTISIPNGSVFLAIIEACSN